jgi:hypothetical protein
MKLADNNFIVVGCMSSEPSLMVMDPVGSLRQQAENEAEIRLRESLNRHVDNQDTYVRVVTNDAEGNPVPGARQVRNPRRWVCGSEVAQTVLNSIGVTEAVAMLQAAPQDARDMYQFVADRLAPEAPAPVSPQLDQQQRQEQGRPQARLSPRVQYRQE